MQLQKSNVNNLVYYSSPVIAPVDIDTTVVSASVVGAAVVGAVVVGSAAANIDADLAIVVSTNMFVAKVEKPANI